MATSYEIKLFSPMGTFLTELNAFESFDCALVENDIGRLVLTLPVSYNPELFLKDSRIAVYRGASGRAPTLLGNALWFVRRRRRVLNDKRRSLAIHAVHANDLLRRRIVAYDAGTPETSKTDQADDMAKAIVRENFVSATDTARNLSSALFSVAPDVSAAPSLSKAFTRRRVLAVLQELAQAAAQAGTYMGFEVWAPTESSLEFRTYTKQRGADRRVSTSNALILSAETGTLGEIELDEDWADEATYVYAGGQGEGADRAIGTASNTTAIGESPFGRIEDFYQDNQTSDQTQLDDDADNALYAQRGRRIFSASVSDTSGAALGVHYDWGDLVTAADGAVQIDCRVDPVHIQFDKQNGERLDIRLRNTS